MLVDACSTPGSASPSLLDSPTLARVERARLRLEGVNVQLRHTSCQGLLNGNGARELTTIKRGLLWQQRDRLFSRWKERYFILTRDYLHCFKRSSGSGADKISEMGQFIFKVKLVEVERVEWLNRKSYSAVALDVGREGRVLLRATDGLEDWFELLEECMLASKERRRALRFSHDSPWQRDETHNNNSVNSSLEEWLLARHKIAGLKQQSCDSVPDLQNSEGSHTESRTPPGSKGFFDVDEQEPWLRRRPPHHEQRLSLLTDIDLNGCDLQLETPPPSAQSTYRGRPQSYRLNSDVFFMSPGSRAGSIRDQSDRVRYAGSTTTSTPTPTPTISSSRSVLTPAGSFRSSHLFNAQRNNANRFIIPDRPVDQIEVLRYRDRSHSDVHCKADRLSWHKPAMNRRPNFIPQATQV